MLALAFGLAGCSSANVAVGGRGITTTGVPPAGTGVTGGYANVNVQAGSAAGVVAALATIAALLSVWRDVPPERAVPEMLEGRAIREHDCTKPLEDWTANLRCK